jgi:hypothetical protein
MDGDLRDRLLKMNIQWVFNPPTASHMGGVWERKIRTVRKVLTFLYINFKHILDDEAFATLMCEVESIVNSRPLTTPSNDPADLHPLTPNMLLTQKIGAFLPPPGHFQKADTYCRKRWRRVQFLADQFWRRWQKEFLTLMHIRNKWAANQSTNNINTGDIVVLDDQTQPRSCWPLARVIKCYPGTDGITRSVDLRTQNGCFKRPVTRLVLLVPVDEQQ